MQNKRQFLLKALKKHTTPALEFPIRIIRVRLFRTLFTIRASIILSKIIEFFDYFDYFQIHPWTEVVYQNLESKNALFYIFDSTGSVFENSEKPLF